jgi:hypothetical protein
MRNYILLGLILIVISCNREPVTPTNPIINLMNLKVGNYWVYDWYEINLTNGDVSNLSKRDSIVIEKDSVVADRTYYIKSSNLLGSSLRTKTVLFDSINTIYSFPEREIILTLDKSVNYTRNFGTEQVLIAVGYYSLDNSSVSINVPAGTFQSINFKGRIESQEPNYQYGIRYNDNYYSDKVGLVKMRTQIYSAPNDIEMRLVRHGSINLK